MTTKQTPIGFGFWAGSTTTDVIAGIDLTGKTAIVTGGYSGLGRETVRTLRSAGASVIVPTRDYNRAVNALAGIEGVEIKEMDLLNPASIDAFAEWFLASGRPLHILVNSAGIMACPLARDSRGYESQFSTNHLGHFQLTTRLWPALRRANGARVVSVSSWGHHFSPVVFDDPNFERREYGPWLGYGQSKTANVLFAVALDERGKKNNIRAFALHPGSIFGTGLEKHVPFEELVASGSVDEQGNAVRDPSRNLKTVEQGAATSVWCATSPQLDGMGGVYCENCDIAPLEAENPENWDIGAAMIVGGVMPYAVDPEAADHLWNLSEQLVFGGKQQD
ncbi:NAD(P)-dependent dehydrogenase (short-subunit alcohol dehydrogenase family) [Kineothrix alysoides]|uniref:Probable oxidoreductase n=1 Tax=Kineothrix alysoides TaxID=1469948 RepID=A0A4R1QMF2_9FIRM|nr:oxidoreductase [Kineothrix alysoides]TCL54103.1 NAD(P)-dependent dehydrogenase (short-subunit alcohol dehydrogenase family) [Kineothrix alysoides]